MPWALLLFDNCRGVRNEAFPNVCRRQCGICLAEQTVGAACCCCCCGDLSRPGRSTDCGGASHKWDLGESFETNVAVLGSVDNWEGELTMTSETGAGVVVFKLLLLGNAVVDDVALVSAVAVSCGADAIVAPKLCCGGFVGVHVNEPDVTAATAEVATATAAKVAARESVVRESGRCRWHASKIDDDDDSLGLWQEAKQQGPATDGASSESIDALGEDRTNNCGAFVDDDDGHAGWECDLELPVELELKFSSNKNSLFSRELDLDAWPLGLLRSTDS
mmetsp:Transcript_92300/g.193018  ORF Transcript_92300/g.193018 Transcript_92300/m.193018 type:complete len:277 (+) Transcript_92300:169-999(+)